MQQWLEELCEGRHEAFGLPLLAAGICGISATLVWLLQMSEEDAGYFGRLDRRSYRRCEPSTDLAQARPGFWESLVSRLDGAGRSGKLSCGRNGAEDRGGNASGCGVRDIVSRFRCGCSRRCLLMYFFSLSA